MTSRRRCQEKMRRWTGEEGGGTLARGSRSERARRLQQASRRNRRSVSAHLDVHYRFLGRCKLPSRVSCAVVPRPTARVCIVHDRSPRRPLICRDEPLETVLVVASSAHAAQRVPKRQRHVRSPTSRGGSCRGPRSAIRPRLEPARCLQALPEQRRQAETESERGAALAGEAGGVASGLGWRGDAERERGRESGVDVRRRCVR